MLTWGLHSLHNFHGRCLHCNAFKASLLPQVYDEQADMPYAQQQDMYPAEDDEAAWEQRRQMIVRRCSPLAFC